jgi:hypothetical protein
MLVGEQIRIDAKEKGISHLWISNKISMNNKTFSGKINRDSFTALELLQIANVLNLDLNELKNKLDQEEKNKMEKTIFTIENIHDYMKKISIEQSNELLNHCNKYDIEPKICAWYTDLNDLFEDYKDHCNYDNDQIEDLLDIDKDAFCTFLNGEIVKLVK